MRRCKDCAKWREHLGYCPIYATQKAAAAKMCDWMRKQTHNEYARAWMRENYAAKKVAKTAAKAKRKGAKRK